MTIVERIERLLEMTPYVIWSAKLMADILGEDLFLIDSILRAKVIDGDMLQNYSDLEGCTIFLDSKVGGCIIRILFPDESKLPY